jgi:hypothetical protein
MTHLLELSYEVYEKLQQAAAREGVSPADWIEARLPVTAEGLPNRPVLARYLGGFDSSQELPDPKYRTEFGDIIAEKLRKQGLNVS